MHKSRVYLDHNASTPLLDAARGVMHEIMDLGGNPSSVHASGRALANVIDKARSLVADLAGANRTQVVFTGSATEAITQAIIGGVRHFGLDRVIISAGEHKALFSAAELCDCPVEVIGLLANGTIDMEALESALALSDKTQERVLVAVHMVNGETGVVQPIDEICALVGSTSHILFVDAVQGFGKLPIGFEQSEIDMMALSAHKMGGPAGVGALLVKEHCNEVRLIPGGGQEQGRRGGTQSAMLIAGFGAAAGDVSKSFNLERLSKLIQHFETAISGLGEDVIIFGQNAPRVASVSFFAIPGVLSETALMSLDLKGICVSAGSACSSGKMNISTTLEAMGIAPDIAECALRVSVGWNSDEADVESAISAIRQIYNRHKQQNQNQQNIPEAVRS